jgi:hypothetical protein
VVIPGVYTCYARNGPFWCPPQIGRFPGVSENIPTVLLQLFASRRQKGSFFDMQLQHVCLRTLVTQIRSTDKFRALHCGYESVRTVHVQVTGTSGAYKLAGQSTHSASPTFAHFSLSPAQTSLTHRHPQLQYRFALF